MAFSGHGMNCCTSHAKPSSSNRRGCSTQSKPRNTAHASTDSCTARPTRTCTCAGLYEEGFTVKELLMPPVAMKLTLSRFCQGSWAEVGLRQKWFRTSLCKFVCGSGWRLCAKTRENKGFARSCLGERGWLESLPFGVPTAVLVSTWAHPGALFLYGQAGQRKASRVLICFRSGFKLKDFEAIRIPASFSANTLFASS